MRYDDLEMTDQRLEDALDAAARLLSRVGPEQFTISALSEELGYSRAAVRNQFKKAIKSNDVDVKSIKNILVTRHFSQMEDCARVLRDLWPELTPEWPACWRALMRHVWAFEYDYRLPRHHKGCIQLARTYYPNPSFKWLTAVHSVAIEMVNRAAPASIWHQPTHIINAVDAAVGIMFLSAYRGDWRPLQQERMGYIVSIAALEQI